MAFIRQFSRKAYDHYLSIKDVLVQSGTREIDVRLRLDHIVEGASSDVAPSEAIRLASPNDRNSRYLFDFFGYGLECTVDRSNQNARWIVATKRSALIAFDIGANW